MKLSVTIYQTHAQMYHFEQLPAYAAFLLQEHLDAYVHESIRLSHELNLPLLQHLKHLSEADVFQFSKVGSITFLTFLRDNRAKQQIEEGVQRWFANQLPLVGKYDITAQDITIVNHVRSRVLKHWLETYSTDIKAALKINKEIDDLILGLNTTFTDAYIQILKERIEEELHFSANVIRASPGITYIFDLKEQNISYINGKVEEVMGYSIQEVIGKESDLIADYAHPEDQALLSQFIKELIADREGKTKQAEFRFRDKKGIYRWFRSYAMVYKRDETGMPIQLLGSGFEISKEKEIAVALQKREKQLLEAQAIAHIGSFEWDIINDTSISTPELRNIFEADHRQTLDEMMERVHPDDKEKVWRDIGKSFITGVYASEYRYRAHSGEKVIDTRGVVTYNSEGKAAFMTGTIQDITQRKKNENSLIQKTLELERSNIQLQEFASIASHDLKEPLRKIVTFADMTVSSESDALSERGKTNLNKVMQAALRMHQLIEGILSYSSIGYEVHKQRCSLEVLFKEAVTNLESRIKDTNALITSDGLPEAEVIPFQIQQLFQNLISNALKFSKQEELPRITVTHAIVLPTAVGDKRLRLSHRYLQIEVSDNGIGFDKEASEKIFGLFKRLHGKSAYEGSGLGLAICRKIVENHGGSITATSALHAGATFTVTLPI